MKLEMEEFRKEAYETVLKNGWGNGSSSFVEACALITCEVAEVIEEYRHNHEPNETYEGPNGEPEGIPIELADVVLRVMNLATEYGIDLESAIRRKEDYNKTRGFHHGGKRL